ncbi:MAG TPA: hypothetical protein VIT65_28610 [Microlunatus sp.]
MTIQARALTWKKTNLTALAGAPPSLQPRPYVRSDGRSSVVSYAADGSGNRRIFELALEGTWIHHDLISHAAGNPAEGHTIFPYVRSDGVSAVVYLSEVGSGIMEIHELTLVNGNWLHHNLSEVTGAPFSAGGTIQGYIRADGVTSVIYLGAETPGHIHELALEGGTTWTHGDLTVVAGAPTGSAAPNGSMNGYARSDGVTSVVYSCSDGEVRQLRLGTNRVWKSQTLTADGGEPKAAGRGLFGYVRTDGTNAVVFRGKDKHLYELTQGVNGEFDVLNDLTDITGAAAAEGFVHAYNRGDATSAVIYEGPDFHIHELALEGGIEWIHTDLTDHTNSTPGFEPVGYVRGDGSTAIVYYDGNQQVRQLRLS